MNWYTKVHHIEMDTAEQLTDTTNYTLVKTEKIKYIIRDTGIVEMNKLYKKSEFKQQTIFSQ